MKNKNKKLAESIQYAIGICSLGSIIVAFSSKGLCAIFIGSNTEELENELQSRFLNAILINGNAKISQDLLEIIELIENPYKKINLVLDERGTSFQLNVWKKLREIPVGAIVSYTEIANKMGLVKSVRAVAGACAANPLAIITPCHRVVRKDGGLSGYRWGIERKLKLLQLEKPK